MNTSVIVAGLCAGAALILWPSPTWLLCRITSHSGDRSESVGAPDRPDDPFTVAAALDLFAVCLRSGLPVETAAQIVAASAPETLAELLGTAADLLTLGADSDHAWTMAADRIGEAGGGAEYCRSLATLVRRSSRAGASLSAGVGELADRIRHRAEDRALEKAERAGVAISGPLGLCFLPAFVCLGIVPVVVGLAGGVFSGTL